MAGVFCDAFHADVIIVGLAEKLVGLIMDGTELVVLPDLFFVAG